MHQAAGTATGNPVRLSFTEVPRVLCSAVETFLARRGKGRHRWESLLERHLVTLGRRGDPELPAGAEQDPRPGANCAPGPAPRGQCKMQTRGPV